MCKDFHLFLFLGDELKGVLMDLLPVLLFSPSFYLFFFYFVRTHHEYTYPMVFSHTNGYPNLSIIFKSHFSIFTRHSSVSNAFLGTIRFPILQSPKTNYHTQFFQPNVWLFPISQIQPFHNLNFSIWSLIHAIQSNLILKTHNLHANKENKLHAKEQNN